MTRPLITLLLVSLAVGFLLFTIPHHRSPPMSHETQLTSGAGGRILTNTGVWSANSQWIVYDTRSDAAGEQFDGKRIEMVNVVTKEIRIVYEAKNGAHCGVATWHPTEPKVIFILGPEHPTSDWLYSACHRQGVIVDVQNPGMAINLDARDLTPVFTMGALRGGSHVHVYSPDASLVSFTYEDHLLSKFTTPNEHHDLNQRNIGVSVIGKPVTVPKSHPRNQDGAAFTVLITQTTANPRSSSDDISKAFEEAWVGHRSLAFQGLVRTATNEPISEVFIVDLPEDLTQPGDGPLQGTTTRRPSPPRGTMQRRLTNTTSHHFPGLSGPRHWLRTAHDASRIGFLKRDELGVVQFWTISPQGGEPVQVTHNHHPVASAFTWHPTDNSVAFVMDNSVCVTDVTTGATRRITPRSEDSPRPEACVFSSDGKHIAFVRRIAEVNQICVVVVD